MRYRLIIFIILLQIMSSCVNTRKATYFNDLQDNTVHEELRIPDVIIKENDLLSISVNALNPDASLIFNLPNSSEVETTTPAGTTIRQGGYLVNSNGLIKFPVLGPIKVAGMTKSQLEEYITTTIAERKLLVNPVVDIRFLNYKITVLGEVARPTVITVPNERVTLLEALGLAGDITIFGKRDDVLVIREENGKRTSHRVDLSSADFMSSPFYYLKSNDIVYVAPNKARVAAATRLYVLLPAMISALSVVAIAIDRFLL